jgi:type I restriction enzyme S subunit
MNFNELFGSIPDGWRSCTLGELVKAFNGSIQTGPFGSQLHAADYVEDGIPSIMPKNIRIDGVDDSDIARVSPEDIERLSKYKVQIGDIVYSRRGDVEKCSLVTEKENGWLCGTGCLRVRLQTEEVSPEFLHAYFCHPAVREWIVRHSVGATMPNLNTSILSALPVLVPTPDSIAVITSNWSALSKKLVIDSKINQTLEQMAQAIFKSWFVDFDPVKAKMNGEQPEGMDAETASLFPEKLVESELGLIPEGWEVLPSEKVATVAIGKTPPRKEPQWFSEDSKDVTWISIRDMGNTGTFALDSSEYLTQEAIDKFNVKIIPDNTLILSFKLTVGRVAITHGEMTTNEAIAHYKLSDNARVSTNYLYSYMKQFNFESLGSTSSIAKAVNSKIIKALPVIVPSKEILGSFDSLVKPLFDKIKSNQIENKNLEDLRDTLLPKLLSGEIELEQTESIVEAV